MYVYCTYSDVCIHIYVFISIVCVRVYVKANVYVYVYECEMRLSVFLCTHVTNGSSCALKHKCKKKYSKVYAFVEVNVYVYVYVWVYLYVQGIFVCSYTPNDVSKSRKGASSLVCKTN